MIDTELQSEPTSRAKLSPEFYIHLVFFLAAAVVIIMSFSMSVVGTNLVYLPGLRLPLPESCTSRIFFGIDCPACGMTRSFISISHGEFGLAWNFNPSSYIVYLFVAVQIPWQAIQMLRVARGKQCIEEFWIYILPLAMAAAMLTQWLIRLFF